MESVCTGNRTVGSNPTLSASPRSASSWRREWSSCWRPLTRPLRRIPLKVRRLPIRLAQDSLRSSRPVRWASCWRPLSWRCAESTPRFRRLALRPAQGSLRSSRLVRQASCWRPLSWPLRRIPLSLTAASLLNQLSCSASDTTRDCCADYGATPSTRNARAVDEPVRSGVIAEYSGEWYQRSAAARLSKARTTMRLG